MPDPSLTPYLEAQLAGRRLLGGVSTDTARTIARSIDEFALELSNGLRAGSFRNAAAVRISHDLLRDVAADLKVKLERAIASGRNLTFAQIESLMDNAAKEAVRAGASLGVEAAAFGAVRIPAVSMLGAYESLGAPATWATLLGGHVDDAGRVIRRALVAGNSPTQVSRALREFVRGSEGIPLDQVRDLRKLKAEFRDAAKVMRRNADRIAFTELGNARAEAEVQHFRKDPLVKAVRWTLSPNRGVQDRPDECDLLAGANYYGLGRGIYPVNKVPRPPHPYDRCERLPVLRSSRDKSKKPDPDRILLGPEADVPGFSRLTAAEGKRARARAFEAVRFGELGASRAKRKAVRTTKKAAGTRRPGQPVSTVRTAAQTPDEAIARLDAIEARYGPTQAKLKQLDVDIQAQISAVNDKAGELSFKLLQEVSDIDERLIARQKEIVPLENLRDTLYRRSSTVSKRHGRILRAKRRAQRRAIELDVDDRIEWGGFVQPKHKRRKIWAAGVERMQGLVPKRWKLHGGQFKGRTTVASDFGVQSTGKFPGRANRGRSFQYKGQVFMDSTSGESIVVHEFGHALEHFNDDLAQAARDFLARRTAGEQAKRLKNLFPNSGYGFNEVAKPDAFPSPYVGKIYSGGATEVTSMGLQYMAEDPWKFAQVDRDYFDFIFNVMRGQL